MLTNAPLGGRYARYKALDRRLVRFLVKNASPHCDLSHVVRSLRGKDYHDVIATGATIDLRPSEYLALAYIIQRENAAISIPLYILRITQEAIRGRHQTAHSYIAKSLEQQGVISDADRGHQFMISILEEVFAILKLLRCKATIDTSAPPLCASEKLDDGKEGDSEENLIFEAGILHLKRKEQEARHDSITGTEEDPTDTILTPDSTSQEGNAEIAFELLCFLQDLNEVREFIRETSIKYRKGDISFLAATMTAEIGFALLKCMDAEFTAMHPELDTHQKLMDFLGLVVCTGGNVPSVYIAHTGEGKMGDTSLANKDLLCATGIMLAEIYSGCSTRALQMISDKRKPELARGDAWQHMHPLAKALLENSNIIHNIGLQLPHYRLDDFVEGIAQRKLPTWLAVACQVQMEVYDNFGASVGVKLVKASLEKWQKAGTLEPEILKPRSRGTLSAPKNTTIPTDVKRALDRLDVDMSSWRRGDIFGHGFHAQLRKFQESHNRYVTGLESVLPCHAGGTAFDIMTTVLEKGCRIANRDLSIHCVAYLYKACQLTNLLNVKWQDIDFLIDSQNSFGPLFPSKLDEGSRLDQYRVHFEGAIGCNVTYHLQKGSKLVVDTEGKGKMIKPGAKFIAALQQKSREFAPDTAKGEWFSTLPKSKIIEMLLHRMATDDAKQSRVDGDEESGPAESNTFTPVELLSTFSKSFQRDETIINFDFVQFWERCSALLKALNTEAAETLKTKYFTAEKEEPWMLTWRVLEELSKTTREKVHETTLAKLAPLLKTHIEKEGKILVQQARHQSSGQIPRGLRPAPLVEDQELKARHEATTEALKEFGTTVLWTGKIATLYHPKLTVTDMDEAIALSAREESTVVPWYMVENEDTFKEKGGEKSRFRSNKSL